MITNISGTIKKVGKDHLVVGVGGLGLRVFVPKTVLENVGGIGRSITLHTHFIVREDGWSLYGFEDEEDLGVFELLLEVNGVGPKVALSILSTLSPELLKSSIVREESAVLQRVPGIGKKTADRILFQLREKMETSLTTTAVPLVGDVDADVIEVLTSLGFSIIEAQSALQHIPREIKTVDERVQQALQYLDQR